MQQALSVSNWWNAACEKCQHSTWQIAANTLCCFTQHFKELCILSEKWRIKSSFPLAPKQRQVLKRHITNNTESYKKAQLHRLKSKGVIWGVQLLDYPQLPLLCSLKSSFHFITVAKRDDGINHTEEEKSETLPCKVRKQSEAAAAV